MSIIQSLNHHATLFIHKERASLTQEFWKELQLLSPAHILHDKTIFDIDTARTLISWANTPYSHEKTALLSFHIITIPAQNALLKILEEPKPSVKFILITSNKEALIPTLRSRLQLIEQKEIASSSLAAEVFLKTPQSERMKLQEVVTLLNAVDEENRKNREGVRAFILDIVDVLKKQQKYSSEILVTLEMASYAGDSSSSGKSIIEYLSLLLPRLTT